MSDNFEIEDLLENLNKKEKRKNTSKSQGNRGENNLAKVLKNRFIGKSFFRCLGSGNRGSQVELTEEIKGVFTADLVCPTNFKFVVECKYGYTDIELCGIFSGGIKFFDEWLEKVRGEADSLNKHPMLCWRKPYQKWLTFIPLGLLKFSQPITFLKYNAKEEWALLSLDLLLSQTDEFFFSS